VTAPGTPSKLQGIIPRWEWRTFGHVIGPAEAAFAAMTSTGIQESDETYLLTVAGGSAKVRDDLMDVKLLRETDADGLERWEPVMKASFPMSPDDVGTVLDALGLRRPVIDRDRYTLDEFVAAFGGGGAIRAVEVHKRRVRYKVNGCTSEVTDVVADGKPSKTIAIESEDKAAVLEAVRQTGLSGYLNTSYPKGLVATVEDRPERYAVIDVGTNSVKFHVAERDGAGFRPVADRADVSRLGEGIQETGAIAPAAIERTVAAITGMVDEAKRDGAVAIVVVGTAGLRMASNAGDVLVAVKAATGVTIDVISGEDESRLAYLAAVSSLGVGDGTSVVFDTGGGSSQFTFGQGARVDERFSVDVGAVRYTDRFGLDHAVGRDVVDEALTAIAADLSRLDGRPKPDAVIGMGGGVTNITAVKHGLATYDPDVVHGTVLDLAEIDRQIELYRTRDSDARREIVGLQPKRAEVILAGACIIQTILTKLEQQSMTVSDRGLRHGVLVERFGAGT
jgi:exopolyphosphatase/guanosine-5'-triphosphate,3'-diphosphate pyrophosphatase